MNYLSKSESDVGHDLVSRLKASSEIISIIMVIVGFLVLIGWAFNITILKSPYAGFSTIKSNTALAFIFIGISLWLLQTKRVNSNNRRIAQVLALVTMLLGVLTLTEYLLNVNIGIDQMLFKEAAGALNTSSQNRMGFPAALNLTFAGLAILFLDLKSESHFKPSQVFAVVGGLISILALIGYTYTEPIFYHIPQYTAIALYATLIFILLFLGILTARPDSGFMKVVTENNLAGRLFRRYLPVVIIIPIIIGIIGKLGHSISLYDHDFSYALISVLTITTLISLLWVVILPLRKSEIQRKKAEVELIKSHENLEEKVKERTIELKKSNSELQSSKKLMEVERDLLQNVMDGAKNSHLVYLDRDFNFIRVNEAYALTCGYKPEEMIGKNHFELYPHEENEAIFSRVRDTGEAVEYHDKPFEFPDQPERGTTYWDWTLIPVKSQDEVLGLIFSLYETTKRKNAELRIEQMLQNEQQLSEELQVSNEELINVQHDLRESINKLEISNRELEQFAYVASHDLQEPLRMVGSFTQLLQKRYKDQLDKDADEFIEFIVEGANRMKDLIDDLLAFSRLNTEAKPFELVNMGESVNSVLSYLKPSIKESNAEITRKPLPSVMADASQMRQLFQNLISNAIKYRADERPKIHISAQELEKEWKIAVSDNGIGIDPEHQKKIFDIFSRLHTREQYPGTGIGLAICKRIVERHGGQIWVESETGKGSTFYFTVPK